MRRFYIGLLNKRQSPAKSQSRPQRRKVKLSTSLDTAQIAKFQQRKLKPLITLQRRRGNVNQQTTSLKPTTTLLCDNDQTRK